MSDEILIPNIKEKLLFDIAKIVKRDWKKVNYAAKPYLDAMLTLNSISENYGYDSGKSVVLYFLGNAGTWRGAIAREVKAELKRRCDL